MAEPVFSVTMPERWAAPVIFSSPHSGATLPGDLAVASRLDPIEIRSSEDAFVDELFAAAPRLGAPLIAARLSRAYVDLNRSAQDLDPALIHGVGAGRTNARTAAGLGVIPRVVGEGRTILPGRISMREARGRLESVWYPYHNRLAALISAATDRFGCAILIDCHSMPSSALPASGTVPAREVADVVLGDRYGTSCAPWLSDAAAASFAAAGFGVARNTPFAGGYITERYGRPRTGVQALQIEINRGLYMAEARLQKAAGFDAFRARIETALEALIAAVMPHARVAAE